MLPEPPRYQELLNAAKAEAAKGHTGARLAVHEFEAIGARVEVFWSGNDTFFPGIITAFDKASLSHRVTYDEGGEHHWLRLWREGEVIRVLSFRGDEDGKDEGDKENAGDGANDEGTPRQKGEQEVKPETKSEEERQVVPVNDTLVATDVEEEGAKSEPNEPAKGEDAEEPVEPLPPLPPQLEDVPCLVCGRLDGEEDFVLCDGCPSGGHYRCLRMDAIPTGDWYCDECQKKGKVCKPDPAPTEDENPVTVVCKNKAGMFHPGQGTNGMIRCLCGPCEVATREGRHSVSWQEPARWEAHCGMRGTRKWKSSVRVVLNPGKGFLGGPGYQTTPVGKWMEMEREGMSFAQLQARAAATGKGEDGVEMGIEWVPVDPHDVDKCAAQARELREAFLVASTKRSGLRVTAGDWAAALSTSTGPCARRSAAGGALAAVGAPLRGHLAPALAAPLVDVLIALNDARAPLEPAACAPRRGVSPRACSAATRRRYWTGLESLTGAPGEGFFTGGVVKSKTTAKTRTSRSTMTPPPRKLPPPRAARLGSRSSAPARARAHLRRRRAGATDGARSRDAHAPGRSVVYRLARESNLRGRRRPGSGLRARAQGTPATGCSDALAAAPLATGVLGARVGGAAGGLGGV